MKLAYQFFLLILYLLFFIIQVQDNVCLQSQLKQCTPKNFQFLDINYMTSSMRQIQAQGILGVGILKSNPESSFIQKLFDDKQIPEPSFSLYISDISYDKRHQKDVSKLILGGIEMKYAVESAAINYHSIMNAKQWSISLQFAIFNKKLIKQQKSNIAIIDSGASNLILPREDYNYLLKSLAIDFEFKCNSYENVFLQCSCPTGDVNKFPEISIKFNGSDIVYTLNPTDYVIQENHQCNLLISTYSSNDNAWILGDVFLRKYMAYFNIEKETIGFILSNQKNLKENELAKNLILILECFLGSLFIGFIIIYIIRALSGLKNAKDEVLNFN